MNEDTLNRLRAEGMTTDGLHIELARIANGIRRAARPRDVARYERRRAIFLEELGRRSAQTETQTAEPITP